MIIKLSVLAKSGGLSRWEKFHDCMLSEVVISSNTLFLVIDDLYDWETERRRDGKVILILHTTLGSEIFPPNHDFCRQIYRFEIDDENEEIVGIFSDDQFVIGVDFSESFVIEV